MNVERTIEFLLDQQATISGNMAALSVNVATLHETVRVQAGTMDRVIDGIAESNRRSEERDNQLAAGTAEVRREAEEWDKKLAASMAEVDRRAEERDRLLAASMAEVDRQAQERDKKLAASLAEADRQAHERDKRLGDRIDGLVSAIGEFVRHRPPARG